MRVIAILFFGLALCSTTASIVLLRELRNEKHLNSDLGARLVQAEHRVGAGSTATTAVVPTTAVQTNLPEDVASKGAEIIGASVSSPQTNAAMPNQREMLKDADYRAARIAQALSTVQRSYPMLIEELGLTTAEANRLFTLLAEYQVDQFGLSSRVPTDGKVDSTQSQVAAREMDQLHAKLESDISAQFGASRVALWQKYQTQRPARMQVAQYDRILDSKGLTLTGTQSHSLLDTTISEQRRLDEEMRSVSQELQSRNQNAQQEISDEYFKRQAESNRRLLEAALSYLNPRQLEVLRVTMDQQLTISRTASRHQPNVPAPKN